MKKKNRIFSFLDVSIIVVVTSLIMCFLGCVLVYKHLGGINYSLLASDEKLGEFISVYNDLVDNYYDTLDKDQLIDGAISGMYSKIDDPYTSYLDTDSTNSLNETLAGEYEGIGITIYKNDDGNTLIDEVFEGSPAERSGLLAGDILLSVNGQEVTNMEAENVTNLIKTGSDQKVSLTVNRGGTTLSFDTQIEKLYVPAVKSQILQKNGHNVGYIRLTVFNDTADIQFTNALNKLENNGIESLIIDLRDNTGGYLEVAKNIAEIFIEKGKTIYSLQNKDETVNYLDETSEKRDYNIIVVINKASASASEILASALKYSANARLLGITSYGKGKVQEKVDLSDGTIVKYTSAKWLTPNGDCIDGIGLTPDIPVEFNADTYNKDDISTDLQVMDALNNLVD